jgi:hypothetical protein
VPQKTVFSWIEKGEVNLRKLVCECGEDVVDATEPSFLQDESVVECSGCGVEYTPEFIVKMVPVAGSSETEEVEVSSSATGAILDGEEGEAGILRYVSSISGNEKEWNVEVTGSERGLWLEMVDNQDRVLKVFGSEVSNREEGELTRDGHRIGEFVEVEWI